jgi:hypothetical protein
MPFSDWIIAGLEWTTQSPTIDAGAQDVTAPLGGLYLTHPTASLSMLARLVAAMTAAGVASPAAFVTEARHVRLTAAATFSVTWGSATLLRDSLGFSGNLSGASSYTAPLRSPLLWSAGKVLTPTLAPLGYPGAPVLDASVTVGPGGRVIVRRHGDPSVVQSFTVRHVPRDRYWTESPVAGQWLHFKAVALWTAPNLIVLLRVDEGTGSVTLSADYSTSPALGPYKPDLTDPALRREPVQRASGFERVEAYYDVSLSLVLTREFAA